MMTLEIAAKLKRSLIKHEDKRNFPYVDTAGKITIGIGYNLSDRGLSDEWINSQYQQDVEYFYSQLDQMFPWFQKLIPDRQVILVDMAFMGLKRLLGFQLMLDALEEEDYARAAYEMLNSEWAKEVKGRAVELAHAMRTGVYNI